MTASLTFDGGTVLTDTGLTDTPLTLDAGRFRLGHGGKPVSARGLLLLPGIIDLHGDGFERHLAPRRGVVTDMGEALIHVETELAATGITTAWLAQFWSWEGGMRGPDFAKRVLDALTETRARHRIDLRCQLRVETHMTGDAPEILEQVDRHGIDYVVFNDHLPHLYLAEGRRPPRLNGSALKAGRSPEAHLTMMQGLFASLDTVPGFLTEISAELSKRGLTLGSHDDPDAETRTRLAALGLTISEFPTSVDAAAAAKQARHKVVMGAPNIVRGGSHNKKGIAAESLIMDDQVDAIASDYHYPSLARAAFRLADQGTLSLPDAWSLISSNPAEIMGLSDRGQIRDGARADLSIFDAETRTCLGTFTKGAPVYLTAPLAERLL